MNRVRYNQSGYSGMSRSRRAVAAEAEGMLPLARAIAAVSEAAACPPSLARRCLKRVGAAEWHHVGKYAQTCDYYECGPESVAVRMAQLFCGSDLRRRTIARRQRRELQAAWRAARQAREARELAAGRRDRETRLAPVLAEAAAEVALIRETLREIELTGLVASYRRHATPGRAQALRQMGIDPATIVEVAHA